MRHVLVVFLLLVLGSAQAAIVTYDYVSQTDEVFAYSNSYYLGPEPSDPNGFPESCVWNTDPSCDPSETWFQEEYFQAVVETVSRWSSVEYDDELVRPVGTTLVLTGIGDNEFIEAASYFWELDSSNEWVRNSEHDLFYRGLFSTSHRHYEAVFTSIPVPAAVWLFGSALAGLGWMRRKQTA